jgi:hypothetical protein
VAATLASICWAPVPPTPLPHAVTPVVAANAPKVKARREKIGLLILSACIVA